MLDHLKTVFLNYTSVGKKTPAPHKKTHFPIASLHQPIKKLCVSLKRAAPQGPFSRPVSKYL